MAAEMYVARETFFALIDGQRVMVKKGRDLVRAGHVLLEKYPDKFKPAPVRFDVEQATAAPGEKRGEPRPAPPEPEFPKHVGGGWWVTPDLERHRGREAALAHMNETPPAA